MTPDKHENKFILKVELIYLKLIIMILAKMMVPEKTVRLADWVATK
jgi:hypothetical protein